jgi:hypothetical protein
MNDIALSHVQSAYEDLKKARHHLVLVATTSYEEDHGMNEAKQDVQKAILALRNMGASDES